MAKEKFPCAWCSEMTERKKGDSRKVYCSFCGHRADAPQAECDCRKCRMRHKDAEKPMERVA